MVDRQRDAFDIDDDAPHVPSTDSLSNPQSRRAAVNIYRTEPIDQQISEAYQSASQTETMARQLEARISKIDGAKRHLPTRRYG